MRCCFLIKTKLFMAARYSQQILDLIDLVYTTDKSDSGIVVAYLLCFTLILKNDYKKKK